MLDNGGHHRGRLVSLPGGVGVLLVLELDRGVAELEVADLRGFAPLRHQRDWIRTTNNKQRARDGGDLKSGGPLQ